MELVVVALIQGVFGLLILWIGAKLNRKVNKVTATVNETKDEVKNSHTINFRDDIDSKFKMTNSLIGGVQETQSRQGNDIILLRDVVSSHIQHSAQRDREVRNELVAFRKTLKGEEE